jgi:hypothetical protein
MEGRRFGMIARSFKSVIWVATVGGAALSCYMVSLRVATERADLARVEQQIVSAKREIRLLQTELGTRGRMTQLEDWNANVLALSAPSAAQFVHDDVTLARLESHGPTVEERTTAEVRMASAETGAAAQPAPAAPAAEAPKPRVLTAVAHPAPAPAHPVLHQASYTPTAGNPLEPKKPEKKAEPKPQRQAKAVQPRAAEAKPAPEKKLAAKAKPAAEKKLVAKGKPATEKKPGAEKKLAHAKPVRRPGAAQESDAD